MSYFVVFLFSTILARNAPHPLRAEANHLCRICKQSLEILQARFGKLTKTFQANLLSPGVLAALGGACPRPKWADCGGGCRLFAEDLRAGKIVGALADTPARACERSNWCPADHSRDFLKAIPAQHQKIVDYVNSVQNSWKAALYPRWSNMSRHDFQQFLGAIVDPELRCTPKYTSSPPPSRQMEENFDSATNWPECSKVITDIRDQSNCGCCWAFGGAEAASDRMCIATKAKIMLPLSAQALCFCASSNGCGGGDVFTPWEFIQTQGLPTGGQFNGTGPFGSGMCADFSLPHCHHHGPQGDDPYPAEGAPGCPAASSPDCPAECGPAADPGHADMAKDRYGFSGGLVMYHSSEQAIMDAVSTGGPVEAAFMVYEDFANYVSGIYVHTTGALEGGHAIRIVGWGVENGVKYWKVANSWNPYWGENGYFRIVRGINECGIESQGVSSSSGVRWGKTNV